MPHTTESETNLKRRHRTRQSAEYYASLLGGEAPFHLDDIDALHSGVNARQARDVGAVIDSIWSAVR